MNREQAIDYLKNTAGLEALARDWVMGETIAIPMGQAEIAGPIKAWPGVLYLVPINDQWAILDDQIIEIWPTLEKAVERAADYVCWWEEGLEARRAATQYRIDVARERRSAKPEREVLTDADARHPAYGTDDVDYAPSSKHYDPDHAYLSAGDNPYADGDRAYTGCSICGRSRKEHGE